MQRRYLEAALGAFDPAFGDATLNPVSPVYGGRMVACDAIYVWTWDARPYPAFPAATEVWSDCANWATGHWLTGRLGSTPLDGLVSRLLADNAITDIDCSEFGRRPGRLRDRSANVARAMLDPLALAFAFDGFEQDGILCFRQRGGAPVAELTEDALVLPDETAPVRLIRMQERDLPREVTLGFTDSGAEYQRGVATSRRLAGRSTRSAHADLAIVTNDAEAERRAEIWLQDLWAGRESADFGLPPSRLALGLGDVVALTVKGRRRLIELQEITDTEARAINACSIDPSVFNLMLSPPRNRLPTVPPAIAPVHALLVDLPILGTETVLARLAVFADPWPGSVAVWASADGLSYRRAGIALAPTVVGKTLDDLPSGPTARWQRTNFRVHIYGGALTSVSDAALFAGANAAAVQRPDGAWEVIQFANAELVGERAYLLSRLLRGQAGSEGAMGAPLPSGSPFVLLDGHLVTVASGLDSLERSLQLRIVMADRDHGDPTRLAMMATPHGTALRPLAPVHLKAARSGAGVAFSWIRRTRVDGDTWVGEVPLGEDIEQYAIDILSGTNVVRTIISATPSVLYPLAAELADFGSAQASLHVRVAQLSATMGRSMKSLPQRERSVPGL